MKTRILKSLSAVLLTAPLFFTSCQDDLFDVIDGTGEITQATVEVEHFHSFVNAINADVYLTQGDQQGVEIKAQANIIDNIRLDVVNGSWRISYRHPVGFARAVKIYITIPKLNSAIISGSGDLITETPFTGLDKLSLVISGSGNVDVESETEKLDVLISGSGNMHLSGMTGSLKALVTGSGHIDAYQVSTPVADVTISGSGSIYVAADDVLDVLISGSGSVYYRGNPEVNATISGSGRVRHDQ
jgi:hypothetical protein